jgi:hypothetical protein
MKGATVVSVLAFAVAATMPVHGQVAPMPKPRVPAVTGETDAPLPQTGQEGPHSARLGDLQVTFTAARFASDRDIEEYGLRPRAGHADVLVFVTMRNAGRYPSCSYVDEWLYVKQGYEYPKLLGSKIKAMPSDGFKQVLPTEQESGEFAFEVKAGTEPVSVKLVRNLIVENVCISSKHRDTRAVGPESLSLSLMRLPADTN